MLFSTKNNSGQVITHLVENKYRMYFVGNKYLINSVDSYLCDQLQSSYATRNHSDILNFDLTAKGLNFAHFNVQGLCRQNMSKFSQLKDSLESPVNNSLHLFGLNETKLKEHKLTNFFA